LLQNELIAAYAIDFWFLLKLAASIEFDYINEVLLTDFSFILKSKKWNSSKEI
jgi:hypothetical protein